MTLIDTAGIRRRTKVAGTVDYYAQLRSERAAERADVAIVVCDATEGVTADDLRVAELAMKTGCATLVALNKWDLVSGDDVDLKDLTARVHSRVRQRPPVIATSAKTGRGVPKLLERALALADRRAERIPTPELNRFVAEVVATRPPPQKRGKRLRLYYAAQVGTRPPRIAIQVNDRRVITRDWAYHLENRMREHYSARGRAADHRPDPEEAAGSRGITPAMDRAFPGRILAAVRRGLATAGRALLRIPRAIARGAGALLGAACRSSRGAGSGSRSRRSRWRWRSSSASRCRTCPASCPAATPARRPTTRRSSCPPTRSPTCTRTWIPRRTTTSGRSRSASGSP